MFRRPSLHSFIFASARSTVFMVLGSAVFLGCPANAQGQEGVVSERAATWASVLGTLLPVAAGVVVGANNADGFTLSGDAATIIDAGVLVGPSLGHFYAREPKRALLGIGVRGAALGIHSLGASAEDNTLSDGVGTLGLALFVTSALIDIAAARKSARRHNERVSTQGAQFTPLFDVRGRAISVVAHYRF